MIIPIKSMYYSIKLRSHVPCLTKLLFSLIIETEIMDFVLISFDEVHFTNFKMLQ